MDIRPEYAWAAFATEGSPYPFIHAGAVRSIAAGCRAYIGEAWAHEGETVQQGWKRARRNGWRIIRVKITAFGGSDV